MTEAPGIAHVIATKLASCDACSWRRQRRRAAVLGIFLGLLTGSIQAPPRPRLLWNASASAPTGLYRIHPNAALRTGDTVAASTPNTVRALADRRGYLPANVPLVKRVAAGRGSLVCAISLPCQEAGAPPVGLTLAGAGGTDDHLLDVAGAVEAILQRRR